MITVNVVRHIGEAKVADLNGNFIGKADAQKLEDDGYVLIGIACGQPSPYDKRSNLYKVFDAARNAGYTDIDYIISGKRQRATEGFTMIVMAK